MVSPTFLALLLLPSLAAMSSVRLSGSQHARPARELTLRLSSGSPDGEQLFRLNGELTVQPISRDAGRPAPPNTSSWSSADDAIARISSGDVITCTTSSANGAPNIRFVVQHNDGGGVPTTTSTSSNAESQIKITALEALIEKTLSAQPNATTELVSKLTNTQSLRAELENTFGAELARAITIGSDDCRGLHFFTATFLQKRQILDEAQRNGQQQQQFTDADKLRPCLTAYPVLPTD